jgi:RimJ/RimL family protein N-acetyltransferase
LEHLAGLALDGVELGYTVYQPWRRRKYATEAIIALMHWAYAQYNQRCFVLAISPQNFPSTAMAEPSASSGAVRKWMKQMAWK